MGITSKPGNNNKKMSTTIDGGGGSRTPVVSSKKKKPQPKKQQNHQNKDKQQKKYVGTNSEKTYALTSMKKIQLREKKAIKRKRQFDELEQQDSTDEPSSSRRRGDAENDDDDDDNVRAETRDMVREQNRKKKKSGGFQAMGLSHGVFKGITHKGYKIPTPIQRKTIPLIMEGKDVVAMARTGSGKTAAFLIPLFERLKTHAAQAGARAIIMSPTRELALQTLKFTKEIGKYTGLKAAVILGGDKMDDQFDALHSNPDVIIATPGRFMHVVLEMELKLSSVEYICFDEADRLFEMGFESQLREIIHRLSDKRQTVLFSATLPKQLVEFAKAGLHNPVLIRLDVDNKLSQNLQSQYLQVRAVDKDALLLHILTDIIKKDQQTVVFAATKHHVEYLNMLLEKARLSCCCVYSALDQTARKINVAKFQQKKCSIMLVTDLAARGIDIPMLDNVINYHFPAKAKLFVHRVGRVARAGRSGTAYSLIAPDELPYLVDLHLFLGRPLKFSSDKVKSDSNGIIGTVPQSILDLMDREIKLWRDCSVDMQNMDKVCANAFKLYMRSRPAASSESIKRVKELNCVDIAFHPLIATEDKHELERANLLTAMKQFRPKSTVFEISNSVKSEGFAVMQVKRKKHSDVISANIGRKAELVNKFNEQQCKTYAESSKPLVSEDVDLNGFAVPSEKKRRRNEPVLRDEENYISYRPSDYESERGLNLRDSFDHQAKGAVLDLTGDDDQQIRSQQNQLKWDRKKKKYIGKNDNAKKIKTESGQWISASYKSDAYNEWLKKSKRKEAEDFENSDDEESKPQSRGKRSKITIVGHKSFRHHNDREKANKRRFKPELRSKDQIIKNRKVKELKEFNQKRRQVINQKNANRNKRQK